VTAATLMLLRLSCALSDLQGHNRSAQTRTPQWSLRDLSWQDTTDQ